MLNRIFPLSHSRFHCPDAHQLSAYADQQLIGAERERVERHLASCDACLQQVAFQVKHANAIPLAPPSSLLRQAEQIPEKARGLTVPVWRWAAVASAVVVLAASAAIWRAEQRKPEPNTMASTRSSATVFGSQPTGVDQQGTVRGGPASGFIPVIQPPVTTARHLRAEFKISWPTIVGAVAYDVKVTNELGDLVWRIRVKGTSAKAPSTVFQRAQKYFVWVDASLPDGRAQQSSAVGFVAK